MSKHDKQPPSELAAAADALEAQLRRFESLGEQLRKAPLNSEKGLERASSLLRELADLEPQLNERVGGLVAAVKAARDRQSAQATSIQARALEMQERANVLQELLLRYGEIGQGAAALNQRMQQFAARRGEAQGSPVPELVADIDELQERMAQLAAEAQELMRASEEKDFKDLARQADSLRQQLLSARNKLGLLRKPLLIA